MTHTLHRRGTLENLSDDYVLLCMAEPGINDEGSVPKVKEFLRITMRHNPKNIGEMAYGNMYSNKTEDVIANASKIVHAVYDTPEAVVAALKDLKEADLGLSVVVSGILDKVNECCEKAGLKRHTVNFSLGIWGKTEKLPPEGVLQITTMCGHGLVPANLVTSLLEEVKKGSKSADDAGKELARHCCCGIFNPLRASKLLAEMAKAA